MQRKREGRYAASGRERVARGSTLKPERRVTRRRWLRGAALALGGLVGLRVLLPWWWRRRPPRPLSAGARARIDALFEGIDRASMWDVHVHLVGLGAGATGCWVNPRMRTHLHPVLRLQYELYMDAGGIEDPERADRQYVETLLATHRGANPEGRLVALAFDWHVDESGRERPELTPFHVPDDYVLGLAERHEAFVPCASVHPYRRDALARLDAALARGARAIKWLPNAMGMDPLSARCDSFYRRLADADVPLLTHGGHESAVEATGQQRLGNPLRLRRALDHGVRVVLAHYGSLGDGEDLDDPARGPVPNVELTRRLLAEYGRGDALHVDASAITFVNRAGGVLREVLEATEHHDRLVNGSDYPLPAIDPVISTWLLQWKGFLEPDERALCEEVFDANPLLFDFVVKRLVGVRTGSGVVRFPLSMFETAHLYR